MGYLNHALADASIGASIGGSSARVQGILQKRTRLTPFHQRQRPG